MPKTSPPMTLAAMRGFAEAQIEHYTELIDVLDRIKADPLSVLPAGQRRKGGRRKLARTRPNLKVHPNVRLAKARNFRSRDVGAGSAASAYAKAAISKLGVASVKDVVIFAQRAGWGTLSKTPDVVMSQALKTLVTSKVIKMRKGPGRAVRYTLPKPSAAALKKLAAAQALAEAVNGRQAEAPTVN
ncbi:MAG: hypothetical protein EHM24_33845 [Acidobacteria bacterium]|nr:MAG: hypothetical protein EHM24_33845 [Acidobacteriota bacterium]